MKEEPEQKPGWLQVLRAFLLGGALGYLACWSLAFLVFVTDLSLLPSYVAWSWTGGGERAVFVQFAGLVGGVFGSSLGALRSLFHATGPR